MNREIKRTYESLPEEEKEQLQKYQKKGITKVTQSVDQETGEILSTETTYSSEKKRVKGTFGISSPEEIIRLCRKNKLRPINKMLPYFIDNMNWNNELSFDNTFIESYGEQNKQRFFTDRKFLLDNQYIFKKPNKKNIYTLNVNLLFRGTMQKAAELYEEQFGEEISQDSKLELVKIKKKITKLSKEDIKSLIEDLEKIGVSKEAIEKIINFIEIDGTTDEKLQKFVTKNLGFPNYIPMQDYYKISLDLVDQPEKLKNNSRNHFYKLTNLPSNINKNDIYEKVASSLKLDTSRLENKKIIENTTVVIPQPDSPLVQMVKQSKVTKE